MLISLLLASWVIPAVPAPSPGAVEGEGPGIETAVRRAHGRWVHRFVPARGRPATWTGDNPARGLRLTVSAEGLALATAGNGRREAGLLFHLSGWGRGDSLAEVAPAVPAKDGNRIALSRGPLTEWYVNEARGVEQGFTVARAPAARGTDGLRPLTLVLDLPGGGAVEVGADGREARIALPGTDAVVRYTGLRAWDARGCELEAWLGAEGARLRILVDDQGAEYPLTIDPWLWIEEAKLIGSDVGVSHSMGASVALEGNTALVGTPGDNDFGVNSGAVYVYVRSGTTWTQEAKLTSSDAHTLDYFGYVVALSGDTALVGSWGANGVAANTGAAYVFTRTGTVWTEEAKLTAADGASSDEFGCWVAIAGDTALIGARFHDHTGSIDDAGGAYVFVRTGTTWAEQNELAASDAMVGAEFGFTLSLTSTKALVGSPFSSLSGGGAYVFEYAGTSWTETAKLTASDLDLQDFFGGTVFLREDTAVVGAQNHSHAGLPSNSGSAYVFTKAGTSWSEQAELLANDAAAFQAFGNAVCVADDTALIGAHHDSSAGTYSGAVYVYLRDGTSWSQQAKLTPAGLGGGDQFGYAVAYEAERGLIGAPGDDDAASNGGSAYACLRTAPASATFRNDTGNSNPLGYTAAPPVIGAGWSASVDNSGTTNTLAWVVGYTQPLELYLPQASDYLLVDPWSPGGEVLQLPLTSGTGVVNFSLTVPNDPTLIGETLATQGAGFGGADGTTLHNAYDLFLGT